MIQGFYTAGSGLRANQAGLDITANNIANLNTSGYKKQTARFSELLGNEINSKDKITEGTGARVSGGSSSFTAGNMITTDSPLDFTILTDGFFGIMKDGNISYTRDGSFSVSAENGVNYLTASDGSYVLSGDGEKISVDDTDFQSKIGLFVFDDPYGLTRTGENKFEATKASGNPYTATGTIASGCLEGSNTNLIDEMTNMINIQKSYQFNAQIIKTADEIEDSINHLR